MILKVANRVADVFNLAVAKLLTDLGWRPEMIGYGAIGNEHEVRIIGRVLMSPTPFEQRLETWVKQAGIPTLHELAVAIEKTGTPATAVFQDAFGEDETDLDAPTTATSRGERGWRQFVDAQIPYYPVLVTVGNTRRVVYADRGGIVDVMISGHGLAPGWHVGTLRAVDREAFARGDRHLRTSRPVSVPVRVVDSSETFGVISDVDDTVMISLLPRPVVAAKNAFFTYISARQAVPGMADLLRTLVSAPTNASGNLKSGRAVAAVSAPVVYLSTGAWNVAPGLRRFLWRGKFPTGTPLLTDWGITQTGWFRSGSEHKRTQLRYLAQHFPQIKWVLVGDDGQHDPTIYADFAREYPGSVRAICIRSLSTAEQLLTHGTPDPQDHLSSVFEGLSPDIPVFIGEDGHRLLRAIRLHRNGI